MKVFNFNAGPAMLPSEVMEQAQREFWVVATRPRQQNGLGMTTVEAAQ